MADSGDSPEAEPKVTRDPPDVLADLAIAEVVGDADTVDLAATEVAPEVAAVKADADAEDPNCHYDCWWGRVCQDGVVKTYKDIPVPCKFWKGECLLQDTPLACALGCRKDGGPTSGGLSVPAFSMCAESVGKEPGAPCQSDADCQGTAHYQKGVPWNVYLACDASGTGTCVAAAEPQLADWMAACKADKSFTMYGTAPYTVAASANCPSGGCLIFEFWSACTNKHLAGCTMACAGDWDCPQNAVCHEFTQFPALGMGANHYCVPHTTTAGQAPWKCML